MTPDTMKPLLSVVVPTYNCESYLQEGLESVLHQLPEDCELIVIDDGSVDGTVEKLLSYEGKRSNLRIIYREHKGASSARNAGLNTANGKYVTFMDCDDCMYSGFLENSLPLLDHDADLYIFGIERVTLQGKSNFWTVPNQRYETAADFADEYIRKRKLLIYSNCNKFYRTSVIERYHLRFNEDLTFGEDRIFNYDFLSRCGRIETSSLIEFGYLERNTTSMSSRYIPDYFDKVLQLHAAKIQCFTNLSKNTSRQEQVEFEAYDLAREIENTVKRFQAHPQEQEENLPEINRIVFGNPDTVVEPIDILILLGSRNCKYKVELALHLFEKKPGLRYIVSGGNPYLNGKQTEAEFMADYLYEHGVPRQQIFLENRATNTRQNLEYSGEILRGFGPAKVVIITGGFHIPRAKKVVSEIPAFAEQEIHWYPAYGPLTHINGWFETPEGIAIVLEEFRKRVVWSH